MIRVVENDQYSKNIEQQIKDILEHEKEYWKNNEWVTRKKDVTYNPRFDETGNNLVQSLGTPELVNDGIYSYIRLSIATVRGNFLQWVEGRAYLDVKDDKLTVKPYSFKHIGEVGRIVKTSLKTPDKQPVYGIKQGGTLLSSDEYMFVKEKGKYNDYFIPYFGEVVEPKKRGNEK